MTNKNFPLPRLLFVSILAVIISCSTKTKINKNPDLIYKSYIPNNTDRVINREIYYNKLQGFWIEIGRAHV